MDQRFVWVSEFISNVRPYIEVRLEDNVLIKRPNVVQKLNPSGAVILHGLLKGKSIEGLLRNIGDNEQQKQELYSFLIAVKSSLEGNLDVWTMNEAVVKTKFEAPFTSLPVLSEVAVTGKCNLRCSFCYAGINHGCTTQSADLSTEQLIRIIRKIRMQAMVPSISFTGGEPTLREDLCELISFAKSLDMRVNLISNGFLIDETMAAAFSTAGLDSAQISLEGVSRETHERITGMPGSFANALNAVKMLTSAGIRTHTNTTLSKQNMHEAPLLPSFLKNKLNAERFSMNLIIPTGSALANNMHLIPYADAGQIIKEINQASLAAGVEFMWYSPTPLCIFNTITEGLGNKGCAACDGLLSVDPEGNILPCSSWNEPLGNLLKDDFNSVWFTDRATQIRNKKSAPEVCFGCDSLHLCQGACPLFYRSGCNQDSELLQSRKSNITQKVI
ncbi:Sporulation killing factor maturation protein SkfB [bioreactor metagenome]|uniref:Sporulation killing factor maturation protein SkfB n=1 Tax=bioreactor metagenome TaxID=1076179 RepID=A0A644XEW0_9ZZZZ